MKFSHHLLKQKISKFITLINLIRSNMRRNQSCRCWLWTDNRLWYCD